MKDLNLSHNFIPLTPAELKKKGISQPDFVYVSGDAYVDHPSFACAIICRTLEDAGYSIAIISQPNWKDTEDFKKFSRPRLAFLVGAGNIDSMVNHYTAAKKRRSEDLYSPGGKAGMRPDRATIVYCNRIREAFPKVPIIIGGIEASLRRFSHYDYWDDAVRHSILIDSGANILSFGMGERSMLEIASALNSGMDISDIDSIPGTCVAKSDISGMKDYVLIPSHNEVSSDKHAYAKAFMMQQREQDAIRGKVLVQNQGKMYLIQNPPAKPLTEAELDRVYELPYTRLPHPSYKEPIPALSEVKFSLTSCRGCFGGCSFCALTMHQGRFISSRSHGSLLNEAVLLTKLPDFKGYIHDIGGPTANFRQPACDKQKKSGLCAEKQCLGYFACKNLKVDHSDYVSLLKKLRQVPGVKKVFIRSGIRYDYVMYDKNDTFLRELILHHVSGQLKVAPEHISDRVLELMNKPASSLYDRFLKRYSDMNAKLNMKQYVIPYLMSSHPGSDIHAAIELALYLKRTKQHVEQVQDFYPTPGTLSTTMYYTGLDPRSMKPVYVPKSMDEKAMQRALLQFYDKRNYPIIRNALKKAGRDDLIGFDKNCLVPPPVTGNKNADHRRNKGDFEPQKRAKQKKGSQNSRRK
ncbi:MAG: YgiQ family radical SAM protein [Clostridia bacterium]|nr:YgiQ family radical SAM protein [Clostridia bacterium]